MKQLLIASLICLTTVLFAGSWTDPETGITWTYTSSNGIVLGGGYPSSTTVVNSFSGELVIPRQINGLSFNIGDFAFYDCSQIESIVIPEGVTSIGAFAFSGCRNLESITLPSTITYISQSAFDGCYKLSSIHISDIASWCNISFSNELSNPLYCDTFTTHNYGNNRCLYVNNVLLTNLIIPQNVTSIKDYAFNDYLKLSSVTIPATVTSIGNEAFSNSVRTVTFYGKPPSFGTFVELRNADVNYVKKYTAEWEALRFSLLDSDTTSDPLSAKTIWSSIHCEIKAIPLFNGGIINQSPSECIIGELVSVIAIPNEDYIFLGWGSDMAEISGSEATLTFTMPEKTVTLVANFFPKALQQSWNETYVQSQIKDRKLITSDQLQEMALSEPMIEVKDGTATVGISVMKASAVDGEWENVELEEKSTSVEADTVKVTLPADEKAAFYKFVVPEKQATE